MVLMPLPDINRAVVAIRRRMKDQELTQAAFAQKIGRVQGWVSSRLYIDPDDTLRYLAYKEPATLERLLKALNWTLPQLNYATGLDIPIAPSASEVEPTQGVPGATRKAPLFDMLSAGAGTDGGTVIGEIDIQADWRGEFSGYVVSGDSMSPKIPDGSTVVIKCQDYAAPGNVIVAWVPEHGMVVKELRPSTREGLWLLTSFNPAYPPIWTEELRIYGVVHEVRFRLNVVNGNHGPN